MNIFFKIRFADSEWKDVHVNSTTEPVLVNFNLEHGEVTSGSTTPTSLGKNSIYALFFILTFRSAIKFLY